MVETKYGKLFHSTELIHKINQYGGPLSFFSHEGELGENCSMGYHCIIKPMCFEKPHSHPFAEMLFFFGGNPKDIRDFGAEVEITLGEEMEKHLLTKTGMVSIPANLMHCPIEVRKVNKPIVFLEISLTSEYSGYPDD